MACEKHKKAPVKRYHECPGCEVESLRAENEAQRKTIKRQNEMENDHMASLEQTIVNQADYIANLERVLEMATDALERYGFRNDAVAITLAQIKAVTHNAKG